MNRFERIIAILLQLQTRRTVNSSTLAAQLGVSTRTVYRDLRTLELAGVPLCAEPGVGYSLADGYRLPPVMFTREEAVALLTAEKLTAYLTDSTTARLSNMAMDKLRAVLRRPDRDYLEVVEPKIQVFRRASPAEQPPVYQQLVAAIAAQQVVQVYYQGGAQLAPATRAIEPVSLYLNQHWHVIAYCRLRQDFCNFRLDRLSHLLLTAETYTPRPQALQQYWTERTSRGKQQKVVLRFQFAHLLPVVVQHLHDTKRQYGWTHEQTVDDGRVEMTFYLSYLPYLAGWLLPYAGAVTVVEPLALRDQLRELARRAYEAFDAVT